MITCKDGIQECFRIFTSKEGASRRATSRRPQRGAYLEHIEMEVYTDGACMKNGKRNTACGGRIWIDGDHPLNKALKVPGVRHSNQIGEIAAVIVAAESLPNYCKLKVLTDSRYVIEGLTEHLEKWEDAGWIGIQKRRIAGSTPKRGTSVGIEHSLSTSKPGGTCLISFSSMPPLSFLSVGFPEPCSFLFYARLNKVKVGVF